MLIPIAAAQAATNSPDLAALEAPIAAVKAEIQALREQGVITAELERKIDVLVEEIERLKAEEQIADGVAPTRGAPKPIALRRVSPPPPRRSAGLVKDRRPSIGGHGEMFCQGFDEDRSDGVSSGRSDNMDLLRAAVYLGNEFNDRFLFNSEVELERATTGKTGSVSVEFAYLDWLLRPEANLRAGILLVPMGFVNELHEPTIFLVARRPDTERVLLPTTWREEGLGLYGDVGSFSYRTYLLTGLKSTGFSASGLRSGRQRGSESEAEDFASVGRLDYTGTPGLQVGTSAYLGDSGQSRKDANSRSIGVGTEIVELHTEWKWCALKLLGAGSQGLAFRCCPSECRAQPDRRPVCRRRARGLLPPGRLRSVCFPRQ